MPTVSFGTFSKRRNSTKQPATLSDQRTVRLKETTSVDHPTFILTGDQFDYNYAQRGSRYYFIEDIRSAHNGLTEVDCVIDVLATYKAEILASTQYVCYSSVSGGNWLADTRIPVLKNATVAQNVSTMNFLFTAGGFYVLSAIGNGDGCITYATDISNIKAMINDISQWRDSLETSFRRALPFPAPQTDAQAYQNFSEMLIKTGAVGNAYLDAPNCIRSCIWVPFFISDFTVGNGTTIKLGAYDTGATAYQCKTTPHTNSVSIAIPWQHADWRRTICESVYLYLPLVGMVSIPSDEIVNETSITVEWSATATDGCIAYRVISGNQVIGTYGANAAVNYPIGISQQASAGEIVQSVLSGAEEVVSGAVNSSLSPLSAVGVVGNAVMTGINTGIEVNNLKFTKHNSCVGGIGGGAGVGLSLDLKCFTVSHDTVINPSNMQQTMGIPTMKPILLSSCSGYCQCANAHVDAPAMASELDAIDSFLNSGFYIE